jgi:Holliday junction resolvasome RuvABC endonuclease subunit
VFIEHGYGKSRRGDWVLGRVQGALMASLPAHLHSLVWETHSGEWKKVYVGNGNAGKPLIEAKGRERGYDLPDENAYDALGIAWGMREKNDEAARQARSAA